jgi:hypothetical protein
LDVLPTVRRPSPAAIRIIEKFLYDKQIRLIDLFQQVDKNKDWMITRAEFRAAIEQVIHSSRLQNKVFSFNTGMAKSYLYGLPQNKCQWPSMRGSAIKNEKKQTDKLFNL